VSSIGASLLCVLLQKAPEEIERPPELWDDQNVSVLHQSGTRDYHWKRLRRDSHKQRGFFRTMDWLKNNILQINLPKVILMDRMRTKLFTILLKAGKGNVSGAGWRADEMLSSGLFLSAKRCLMGGRSRRSLNVESCSCITARNGLWSYFVIFDLKPQKALWIFGYLIQLSPHNVDTRMHPRSIWIT